MKPITDKEAVLIDNILTDLRVNRIRHDEAGAKICEVFYPKIEALQELLTGALKVIASHTVFTGWKEVDAIAGEWGYLKIKHSEVIKSLNK